MKTRAGHRPVVYPHTGDEKAYRGFLVGKVPLSGGQSGLNPEAGNSWGFDSSTFRPRIVVRA